MLYDKLTAEERKKVCDEVTWPRKIMSAAAEEQLSGFEEMEFKEFQTLSKPQQIRKLMLAHNAEFYLRTVQKETIIDKGTKDAIEALTNFLRER